MEFVEECSNKRAKIWAWIHSCNIRRKLLAPRNTGPTRTGRIRCRNNHRATASPAAAAAISPVVAPLSCRYSPWIPVPGSWMTRPPLGLEF